MAEKVRKYRVAVFKNKELLYCKSFYSLGDAIKHYRQDLKDKFPEDKYTISYTSFMTSE